jgi:hypothetical protein
LTRPLPKSKSALYYIAEDRMGVPNSKPPFCREVP